MRIGVRVEGIDRAKRWIESRRAALANAQKTVEVYFDNAKRNALIAAVQASDGRNPFFVGRAEARPLQAMMREGIHETLRTGSPAQLRVRLEEIGESLIEIYRRHILTGRSGRTSAAGGIGGSAVAMRPLDPAYAKRKAEKFGKQPILIATRELFNSLRSRIRGR